MSRIETVTESASVYPVSYDSGYQAESVVDLPNAYTDSSSTTYATINITKAAQAETSVYYNFGNLGIPSGATIISVDCTVKFMINNTTARVATKYIQLYSGSTAKGSSYTPTTTATVTSLTTGTWSASELSNAKVRIYAKRSASNTSTQYYFRFYGATLTVSYSYNTTIYTVTSSSTASGVSIAPASVDVVAGDYTTLSITGNTSNVLVEDNGVDVTSSLVAVSDYHTYTITNISEDHVVEITSTHTGDKIFVKSAGIWKESQDILVKVNGTWQSVSKAFKKTSGNWIELFDKSAMFDSNAIFVRGEFTSDEWLWFMMPEGGTVTLTKNGSPTDVTLEYSIDNGNTWITWVENNNARTVTLTAGQTAHIRNTSLSSTAFTTDLNNRYTFSFNSPTYGGGDIRSLLCATPQNAVESDNMFNRLFYNDDYILTSPILSFTSITVYRAFYHMFRYCSNLEKVTMLTESVNDYQTFVNWLQGVAETGDFYCPSLLVLQEGASGIPTGWTRHNL